VYTFSNIKEKVDKMAAKRKWFDSRKEAIITMDEINKLRPSSVKVFKKKFGRNKGKFFVGSEFEFINLNS